MDRNPDPPRHLAIASSPSAWLSRSVSRGSHWRSPWSGSGHGSCTGFWPRSPGPAFWRSRSGRFIAGSLSPFPGESRASSRLFWSLLRRARFHRPIHLCRDRRRARGSHRRPFSRRGRAQRCSGPGMGVAITGCRPSRRGVVARQSERPQCGSGTAGKDQSAIVRCLGAAIRRRNHSPIDHLRLHSTDLVFPVPRWNAVQPTAAAR